MLKFLKLRYFVLLIILGFVGLVVASNYNATGTTNSSSTATSSVSSIALKSSSSSSISPEPGTSTINVTELKVGDGRELKKGDEATFNYVGTLDNGFEFDSSIKAGAPFTTTIGVGKVIKGWDEGLPGMKVGGKRKLQIPYTLAYGERATPKIPAKSNLTFEVELLSIK